MEFKDISTEHYREYHFPGGDVVRIDGPLKLHVSASGGHRIIDGAGVSHYIAPKWNQIVWKADPPFSF